MAAWTVLQPGGENSGLAPVQAAPAGVPHPVQEDPAPHDDKAKADAGDGHHADLRAAAGHLLACLQLPAAMCSLRTS